MHILMNTTLGARTTVILTRSGITKPGEAEDFKIWCTVFELPSLQDVLFRKPR
jgi:hypothetical protein